MADSISRNLVQKLTAKRGPDYDAAVLAGADYWETVLAGRPNEELKQIADDALSKLIGCNVHVTGRRKT